ncbi:hemolysin D [Erythrobacter sp. SG61-1L]|uniref:efflux RND transporter periplasmic adaptor subunit n=1 Tax=Erythrobacter sp. SG61-1L TaxID=1603897 RepID=UPI0006C8F06D|nr:efflux RND transporter periplasmic adaptor subunit [Erythrobacter sp. SG61-1L]KPL68290.1 hemolysin D [Erythrobacter sp. SG61-1L]
MKTIRAAILSAGLCLAATAIAGCSSGEKPFERPAPQVGFVVVAPSAVPVAVSLGGRTVAYETSEVRPQVTGIIQKRLFTEGSYVRAGQPLYQIDASLYRAAVRQAEANLAAAKASADAATAKANRYKPLATQEAISQQDLTDAEAQARQAQASVAQASAALETARINLRFSTVAAPISGRIGRSLVTTGALASAAQAQPLAVIQRLDPIYVDMQQSSAELTALRQALAKGEVSPGSTSVRLKMDDGSFYALPGTVEFSEISVDESTGTVTLRARFPNPQGLLLPGTFVTAVFEQAVQPAAFLVPQSAVQRDFDGSAFVYIVGKGEKGGDQAKRVKVTADRTSGTDWVVTSGLKKGDRVITQGLANVRQDADIRPVPASAPQRVGPPPGKPGQNSQPGKPG